MKADQSNIQELWDLFVSDRATPEQVNALFEYIKSADNEEHIALFKEAAGKLPGPLESTDPAVVQSILDAIVNSNEDLKSSLQVHRIPLYRRWWWAAASVIILLSAGLYFFNRPATTQQVVAALQNEAAPEEAMPGGNRAVLKLADGITIVLDSAANGTLAMQGNTNIVKLDNGQIAYSGNGQSSDLLYNTMSTPRGGQYQLTLPDGTKVWLNAASSITFPVAFTGNTRDVSVTGEVYFEVAKNKEKPFVVDVNKQLQVEVLGTHFNINCYPEESVIKTTLVEGSVRVSNQQTIVLTPGQQAIAQGAELAVNPQPNIAQVLAWKNGLFDFQDMRFAEAMRQVERWYDIQVVYDGPAPDIEFTGGMDRGIQLSGIIRFLNDYGIKTRLQGRRLIIYR
jgi:Fe2+-dicitrate sensor, membrane component